MACGCGCPSCTCSAPNYNQDAVYRTPCPCDCPRCSCGYRQEANGDVNANAVADVGTGAAPVSDCGCVHVDDSCHGEGGLRSGIPYVPYVQGYRQGFAGLDLKKCGLVCMVVLLALGAGGYYLYKNKGKK